jgi:hypothetical protein
MLILCRYISVFLLNLVSFSSFSLLADDKYVYGFFDAEGNRYIKMQLIGETVSIEKASTLELDKKKDRSLWEVDTRPDTVTIKVLKNPGIRPGQTLYLIEKHPDNDQYKDGNIVGQIRVLSIFNTTFFGEQIRGEGHLRLIDNKIMMVGLPITSEDILESTLKERQGDYYQAKGDIPMAIQSYKKALKLDPNSPEAHYSLARLHETRGEGYISAAYEYSLAWKSRDKFADDGDKFQFFVHYAKFLIYKHKLESSNNRLNVQDLEKAVEVAKAAQRLNKEDFQLNLTFAEVYFLNYLRYRVPESSSETRKKLEEFEELTQNYLERALNNRTQDYKVQSLAVYFYYERLKDLNLANRTPLEMEEVKKYKKRLLEHAKAYKLYRPKNKKFDNAILRAEKYAKSL